MGSESRHAPKGIYIGNLKGKVAFGSEVFGLSDFVFQFVDKVVQVVPDADELVEFSVVERFKELGW